MDALSDALAQWFNFFNGYDPSFTAAAPKPYQALTQALGAYAGALRETLAGLPPGAGQRASAGRGSQAAPHDNAGPIVGDPIGRDGMFEDLRGEMIPYTPEELIEIGNREYAWCETEMKRASRELGFGDDWKKALEKVKSVYVPRGEQPQLVRDLALQAITFVKARDLITVPPLAEDQWRMTMMPPAAMRVNPFFLGGETIQVSYPTDTMSDEDSRMVMRGNGPHLSHATVFHELIPGTRCRASCRSGTTRIASLFDTPFWTEGRAPYGDARCGIRGSPQSPEERIGVAVSCGCTAPPASSSR